MASDLGGRLGRRAMRRGPHGSIAPEVAAPATSSMTLEDLVRDEMRPLLKEWLDTHLPPMVERLVRAELERLIADELN